MTERIEGVPIGTKLARLGAPFNKEYFVSPSGQVRQSIGTDYYGNALPIIIPDNVYGVIDLATVRIPQGWQRDGETVEQWFREVKHGGSDAYVSSLGGSVIESNPLFPNSVNTPDRRRIHVRKIKPKTRRVLVGEVEIPIVPGDRPVFSIRAACESITESGAKRAIDGLLYPSAKLRHARIEERPCE